MDVSSIFHEHGSRLTLYALQLTAGRAEAEEVVQDVLVTLWRRRVRPSGDLLPYLYRSVRNEALNRKRSDFRRRRAEAGRAQEAPAFACFSPGTEQDEFRTRVEEALGSLAPQERELVVLRIWSDLPFRACAEVLSEAEGTLKSRYQRALDRLRSSLRPEVEG
ncbi:MAG: sigma-70 family RNA polymerase sigma factor [Planctomycetota bacterium]